MNKSITGFGSWLSQLTGLLFLFTVLSGHAAAVSNDQVVERIFSYSVDWTEWAYFDARSALVNEGQTIIPFLEKKIQSSDPEERLYAQAIKAHISTPKQVQHWNQKLEKLLNSVLIQNDLNLSRKRFHEEHIAPVDFTVPSFHLIDRLKQDTNVRGEAEIIYFFQKPTLPVAKQILNSPDYIWNQKEHLVTSGMVALGNDIIPTMMKELEPGRESKFGNGREEHIILAANVLAALKHQPAIALIKAAIPSPDKQVDYSRPSAPGIPAGALTNTEYLFIFKLTRALSQLQAKEALPTMLSMTLKAAHDRVKISHHQKNGKTTYIPAYYMLKKHILALGPDIIPSLEKQRAETSDPTNLAALTAMLTELSGAFAPDKNVALLREKIQIIPCTADILRLYDLTGEEPYTRLSQLAFDPDNRAAGEKEAACLALGKLKHEPAIPRLLENIKMQHNYFDRELQRMMKRRPVTSIDYHKLRKETRASNQIAASLRWGDLNLLTLRRIGGDKARKAIAEIQDFPEYSTRLKASLALLDGNIDALKEMLHNPSAAMREEAALALLEQGEETAITEVLRAAARKNGPIHDQWLNYARASGQDLTPTIQHLCASKNDRERILGKALFCQQNHPELIGELSKELDQAVANVSKMHTWNTTLMQLEGSRLAEQLGDNYVPLLEARCVFGHGILTRGISAFALSTLKQPDSMTALAASFDMGAVESLNPAAVALEAYGEQGAALAAKVPAPTPAQIDTGSHMTRHRGAVHVMAEQYAVRGVDEILKGLESLRKDRNLNAWDYRVSIYLNAASQYHDTRFIDPLLDIIALRGAPTCQMIEMLSDYDDDRLVPLFSLHLIREAPSARSIAELNPQRSSEYRTLLAGLKKLLDQDITAHLIALFDKAETNHEKALLLLAMSDLQDTNITIRHLRSLESEAFHVAHFEMTLPYFNNGLNHDSEEIRLASFFGLTNLASSKLHKQTDPCAIKALPLLNAWVKNNPTKINTRILYFFGRCGDDESADILLNLLKSQPDGAIRPALIDALTNLKPKGLVPLLFQAAETKGKPRRRCPETEIRALSRLGTDGGNALLLTLLNNNDLSLKTRVTAADYLPSCNNSATAINSIEKLHAQILAEYTARHTIKNRNDQIAQIDLISFCRKLLKKLLTLNPESAAQQAGIIIIHGPDALKPEAIQIWRNARRKATNAPTQDAHSNSDANRALSDYIKAQHER